MISWENWVAEDLLETDLFLGSKTGLHGAVPLSPPISHSIED
jgi:hypothetical protein